ncbi:MATE family efflux transporter [Peptacetobacter sp.]|uniref:MATE family efflux transporter n=1 Tax=Peptacetobacter sp. TaxID=2991975 RepID=UPI0026208A79|nr:MATE family efflux transporter [Peptacetobacter sp.]
MKQQKLALDLIEAGTTTKDYLNTGEKLPNNISSKMLYKDIITIAWPSLVELMLTQLASMIDMIMVGRLGASALTAVGLTTQPKFLLIAIFTSINVGTTALVARNKGRGNQKKANLILRQAILIMTILSITISILMYSVAQPVIKFMGATDYLSLKEGTEYLQIQMYGILALGLTGTITAALRGAGNSKTAMIYNLTGNFVNVIFNYILIYGNFGFPKLGVAGASLATVIGQFTSFIIACIAIMGKKNYVRFRFKDGLKPDLKTMSAISDIGIPALIEQLVMRVGFIVYAKTVASLGTLPFAVHNICMNIQALSFMNGQAFAVSATSLVGQSLGKKRADMAKEYAVRSRRTGMIVSIILMILFFLFPRQIISLYNPDKQIVDLGARILIMVSLIQVPQGSQFIVSGILRGAGDTRATAIIITITTLLLRPSLAIIMVNIFHLGLEGAWLALIADQLLRSLLVLIRFRSGKWITKLDK